MRRAFVFACCAGFLLASTFSCGDENPTERTDAGTDGGPLQPGDGGPPAEDAGFQGISLTIDGTSATYTEQRAAYGSSAGQLTTLRAFRDQTPFNAGHGAVLTLDAEMTGTFPCAVPGATLAVYQDTTEDVRYGALAFDNDGGLGGSCSITITAYGNVAEFIEGTFQGTLLKTAGPGPNQIVVTNGRFRLRRNIDE
jgi:hypothetical protein